MKAGLYTIPRIARAMGVPTDRVRYAISRHRIEPATKAGRVALFDADQIEDIAAAMDRTKTARRGAALAAGGGRHG